MIRALYAAASGMAAQQLQTDLVANNLANVNTVGYKASRAEFQDLLYQELGRGTAATGPMLLGNGVRMVATQRSHAPGTLTKTGDPLHAAIQGAGFYRVLRPDGSEGYTRDGSFSLNGLGELTTAAGLKVLSAEGEPITIPTGATEIEITEAGVISYLDPETNERVDAARLGLARFANPAGLRALGGNLYAATEASGTATNGVPGEDGLGTLAHRFLENSNVEVVTEMVNLITAQRTYELNSRALQSADSMLEIVNRLRR